MSTRQEVYAAIDSERAYQDAVWGQTASSGRPGTGDRSIDEFILYVFGRSVELSALASHSDKADEKLEHLRKIAALCVACLEQHGAPPRVFANPTDALASRRSVEGTDPRSTNDQAKDDPGPRGNLGRSVEQQLDDLHREMTAKHNPNTGSHCEDPLRVDRCGVFIAQDETCRNPEPCPEHPKDTKMMWRGRRIERLSKEELIEVAVQLASQIEDERLQHKSDLSVIDAEVIP